MLRLAASGPGRAQVTCAYRIQSLGTRETISDSLMPKRSGFGLQALGSESDRLEPGFSHHPPVSASSVRKLNQNATQRIPPCQRCCLNFMRLLSTDEARADRFLDRRHLNSAREIRRSHRAAARGIRDARAIADAQSKARAHAALADRR